VTADRDDARPPPARPGAEPVTADRDDAEPPLLAVLHGSPSAEEIAALMAVLAGARRSPAPRRTVRAASRYGWSARSRLLRAPVARGPGAWRASGLPS
jgi:Acyl-CoA carboxylase epsilon subunit